MPCKNKLDILYFVVASFTWLLWALSKNQSYLRIKTTTIVCQVDAVLTFNKDRAYAKSIQLKLEKQTPASHLCVKHVGRTSLMNAVM